MTRGGRHMKREASERRCIVTGETGPKTGLIRFVVGPDDAIVPDLAEKLPGRGIWVSADADALTKAATKGGFARAARGPVTTPGNFADWVGDLLARRIVDTLSIGRKAGAVIAGFEKVKSLLMLEEAAILFQARDGSDGMKKKLRSPHGADSYFECLKACELGLAFGRDRVIHAAVRHGGIADLCVEEARRLTGLRPK